MLEAMRWGVGGRAVCPFCGHPKSYVVNAAHTTRRIYKCAGCYRKFGVAAGTILEGSKLPLGKWLYTIFRLCLEEKTISVLQLSEELDVQYKTAWRIANSIRRARPHARRLPTPSRFTIDEDRILLRNWTEGNAIGANLNYSQEEIEARLDVLFEKYHDGNIPD